MADYPTMTQRAAYRIRVRGRIDPRMSQRLEDLRIYNFCDAEDECETVLEGELMDQSALVGVIKTLYELHLPVISADCLGAIYKHEG